MAGAEAGWRIVVHVGSAQPELRAALAELPSRARAERLRQLALIGLYNLRAGRLPQRSRRRRRSPNPRPSSTSVGNVSYGRSAPGTNELTK